MESTALRINYLYVTYSCMKAIPVDVRFHLSFLIEIMIDSDRVGVLMARRKPKK